MENRIKILREKMADLKVDAILITDKISHIYFTKFDNEDATLLITPDKAFAFEDFRYKEVADKMLSHIYQVIEPHGRRSDWLGDVIKAENIKTLGIENLTMCLYDYENLKSSIDVNYVGIGAAISDMRKIKDEWEIKEIEKAQIITDKAFDHIVKIINPNMTENDIAAELEYFMRKNGANDKSFETIAVSGTNTSMPHGVPSNEKLQKGFITMDFGALVNGYHADMTRTVCLGKATDEMKKVYNTVLNAQLSALEMLKAGVKCADADKTARDIIDKEYKGCFGHSLGHGVGLEIHEEPALSTYRDELLVKGHIVTVEPGIYIPGKFGVRIEDMVAITENGIKNFTKSPKNLIEL